MKQPPHAPISAEDRFDPDVRFLLANERTLLAWVRTGLALQAGGLALAHFSSDQFAGPFGVFIVLFGALTAAMGYSRYHAADRAIRRAQLPLPGVGPVLEVGLVVMVGLAFTAAYLLGVW
jgi:putative membrane protein